MTAPEITCDYDKTEVFNEKIKPLLKQIQDICIVENIPIFFACATANKDGETTYERDGILTGSNGISLYEDLFRLYLLVGHVDLKPTTRFAEFDEDTLGTDAMDYINDTPLGDAVESEDIVKEENKPAKQRTDNTDEFMKSVNEKFEALMTAYEKIQDELALTKKDYAALSSDFEEYKNKVMDTLVRADKKLSDCEERYDKSITELDKEVKKSKEVSSKDIKEAIKFVLDDDLKDNKTLNDVKKSLVKTNSSIKELSYEMNNKFAILTQQVQQAEVSVIGEDLGDLI